MVHKNSYFNQIKNVKNIQLGYSLAVKPFNNFEMYHNFDLKGDFVLFSPCSFESRAQIFINQTNHAKSLQFMSTAMWKIYQKWNLGLAFLNSKMFLINRFNPDHKNLILNIFDFEKWNIDSKFLHNHNFNQQTYVHTQMNLANFLRKFKSYGEL